MSDRECQPYVLFVCDPTKNPNCSKSGCYLNGGRCELTTYPERALEDKDGYLVGAINYDWKYDKAIARAKPIEGFGEGSFDIRVIKAEKGGIQ